MKFTSFVHKLSLLLCVLFIAGCAKKTRKRITPASKPVVSDAIVPEMEYAEENTDAELPSSAEPGKIEFDRIEAIVEGPVGVERIASSDIKRRAFDGAEHSLDTIIDERLSDQRAQEMKMEVSDEDIDRYLSMRQGAQISKEYLTEMARAHGYTLDEFYEELKRLHRSNNYMDYEVHSRMDIPDAEVKAFYDENPIMEEAVYFIQTTFVPMDDSRSEKQQLRELKSPHVRETMSIEWTVPLDLKEGEVENDKAFILKMKKGDVHVSQDYDGFTLYRLHDAIACKPVPLEDRKQDILNELRKSKFEQVLDQIKKELRKNIAIYYLGDDEAPKAEEEAK
ncbi:MAG TPA: SurA N-terminal domain-containing protein [Candidatus Babeliales bacterium]|nr:SurA N-terminal domain-containing protein [Candidatus Babeliales bacterium]